MAFAGLELKPGSFVDYAWRSIRARRGALPFILAAAAPLLMYHRVYLHWFNDAAYFGGDTTGSYWPDLAFFVRSMAHGELPLWNPGDRGGYPFAFDPQPGVLYPVNWVLVAVGLCLGRAPFALLELKILMHLMLATLGWFVWLQRRCSKPAASLGAITLGLGLFTIQNVHFSLVWPIAWVPWTLVALDRWLTRAQIAPALAIGACVGAMFSAGSPPGALYGAFAIAGLGLPHVTSEFYRSPAARRLDLMRSGAVAFATAALLATPVLLGSHLLTQASVLEHRTWEYVSGSSLGLSEVPALIFPLEHRLTMYAGISVIVLAANGLCFRPFRRVTLSAAILGAVGLLLALGNQTPLLRWVYVIFPPIRYFRLPFRYLYLFQVGFGVLAAIGIDELLSSKSRRNRARAILSVVAAISLAAVLIIRNDASRVGAGYLQASSSDILWITLIWGTAMVACRPAAGILGACAPALVVLADLSAAAPLAYNLWVGSFTVEQNISASMLRAIEEQAPNYRVWDEFGIGYRAGSRLPLRDLRGYMDPLRLSSYEAMAAHLSQAPALLERWGVRWLLTGELPGIGRGHNRVDVAKLPIARRLEAHVYELPAPRAAAAFTDRIATPYSDDELWSALVKDPLGAPLQVPGLAAQGAEPPIGTPLISRDRPLTLHSRHNNTLTFSLEAPTAGWVVVNEAHFPGWIARVDGKPTSLWRVDGWVNGLKIAKGHHRIELAFRPMSWLTVAAVAVIVWFGLAIVGLTYAWRHAKACWQTPWP